MNAPIIRPCKCGAVPAFKETEQYRIKLLRLECACGRHGAQLMYSNPRMKRPMQQAAIDGWNLSDA